MKIMLTGATGFIGRHVARQLHTDGHDVSVLVRATSHTPPMIAALPSYPIDTHADALYHAIAHVKPDVVVHLAAHYVAEHQPNDITALIDSNVHFTARLLDAMAQGGCNALVLAGSAWQHGNAPVNLYAATKNAALALADYYRDAHGLRLIELAIYDSYGPNDPRPKLINQLKYSADSSVTLDMTPGDQLIHLVHVHDLSRAFERACEQASGLAAGEQRRYRLPSPKALTLRQLVDAFNAAGPDGKPVSVRWGVKPYRAREVMTPWEDADVLPGWQAQIDIEDGLKQVRAEPPADTAVAASIRKNP